MSGPVLDYDELTGRNPYGELQKAVYDALRADETLMSKGVKVLDFVPEGQEGPYIAWQTAWLASRDALRTQIDRVWFQLDVWSQYRGYQEVNVIADDVERILRRSHLRVEGFNVRMGVHFDREQSHLLRDPTTAWRRLAITFNCPYVKAMQPTEVE